MPVHRRLLKQDSGQVVPPKLDFVFISMLDQNIKTLTLLQFIFIHPKLNNATNMQPQVKSKSPQLIDFEPNIDDRILSILNIPDYRLFHEVEGFGHGV